MTSPWIAALRSVALNVPDLAQAEAFYTGTWHLRIAARTPDTLYLAGGGTDHHLLALRQADGPLAIRHVSLRARSADALPAIAKAAVAAGGGIVSPVGPACDVAGGRSLMIADPDGRILEIVHGDACQGPGQATQATPAVRDTPVRLAHVIFNSHDVAATQRFIEQALGFTLADRTANMAFMNCGTDHHSVGVHVADNDALNHLAFLMPDLDAVMRGGGRMKDAGHAIEWGPGRHGPGNNAFNYFIDPFGLVIEYTAEVEQIDDSYRPGTPEQWKWPTGRVDHWGIGQPPTPQLRQAQRQVRFAPRVPT